MPQKSTSSDLIIALDGLSSCGKSTVARGLAATLDYKYIDSGAMYRAVTLYCMQNSVDYPNTICSVVWQNRQFSWTQDGKSDRMTNHILRWRTKLIVKDFFDKWKDFDNSYGATMYHADRITPFWADSYDKTVQIDNHIFYKKR